METLIFKNIIRYRKKYAPALRSLWLGLSVILSGCVNPPTVAPRLQLSNQPSDQPSNQLPSNQPSNQSEPPASNQIPPYTPGGTVPSVPQNTPTPPASASCYKGSLFICQVEGLITIKTNAYRASQGLAPLLNDIDLAFVARNWSVQQGTARAIGHQGFPDARQADYFSEFHVNRNFMAENVAMNGGINSSTSQTNADADAIATTLTDQWWNSPGHRANMLGPYQNLGNGVALGPDGAWYGTQDFQ